MADRHRNIRIRFRVTPEELAIITQKQAEAHIENREAFLRKIVMEGQVLVLEVPELRSVSSLLGHCSGNLNQIAKRVNQTGRLFDGELSETKQAIQSSEAVLRKVFEKLESISQ